MTFPCVMKVVRISLHICISLHLSSFIIIPLHFSAFLCISLNFTAFFCISLHFSALLCISLHFSAFFCFLCIFLLSLHPLHFTSYILGQLFGAYRCPTQIKDSYWSCKFFWKNEFTILSTCSPVEGVNWGNGLLVNTSTNKSEHKAPEHKNVTTIADIPLI